MGNSSQLPISRQSKFPPRVLPTEPVRWMQVDFEAAAVPEPSSFALLGLAAVGFGGYRWTRRKRKKTNVEAIQ